jgi:arabinofuranosyltransferase
LVSGAARPGAALSIGMVLYLAYIVRIGGDHMSGRFLAAPLVVACALFAQIPLPGGAAAAAGLCLAVLGAMNLPATWLFETRMRQEDVPWTGIADERAYFFEHLGLIHVTRTMLAAPSWPKHLRAPSQVDIMACGGLGLYGMMHGPATHVADQCALVDPLLSRLPAAPDPHWRIGHLIRTVPAGYAESLKANANLVKDPAVARLYEDVRLVTRGPIWSWRRMGAILRLAQR